MEIIFLWRVCFFIFEKNYIYSSRNWHETIVLVKWAIFLFLRNQTYTSICGHILARNHIFEKWVGLFFFFTQKQAYLSRSKHTHKKPHFFEVAGYAFAFNLNILEYNQIHIHVQWHLQEVCGPSLTWKSDLIWWETIFLWSFWFWFFPHINTLQVCISEKSVFLWCVWHFLCTDITFARQISPHWVLILICIGVYKTEGYLGKSSQQNKGWNNTSEKTAMWFLFSLVIHSQMHLTWSWSLISWLDINLLLHNRLLNHIFSLASKRIDSLLPPLLIISI